MSFAVDEGAVITIIAAAGTDPDYGLPGVTCPRKLYQTLKVGNHTFEAVELAHEAIKMSPWNTRGWTYQEALLSRRCLVFTDAQVYLQCLSDYLHEHEGQTPAHSSCSRVFPDWGIGSTPQSIYSRLSEYWQKRLSYETDILNAFEGIFQAFSKRWNVRSALSFRHFYGIPILHRRHSGPCTSGVQANESNPNTKCEATASFALDLAWKVSENTAIKPSGLFPSWTWASIKPCRSDQSKYQTPRYQSTNSPLSR
jgi:hypothetical protein